MSFLCKTIAQQLYNLLQPDHSLAMTNMTITDDILIHIMHMENGRPNCHKSKLAI